MSNVFALDARSGRELWRWDAKADRIRGYRACCDVVNRGVALYKDKVFVGVIDGRLAALDARTGALKWEVQTTPVNEPYTITGAPRVVEGKVIIGNGGAELGVRGFVSAYDAETGKLAWRFYTVPGDPAKGFESEDVKKPRRRGPANGGRTAAVAAPRGIASRTTPMRSCCMSASATARRGIANCAAPAAATISTSPPSSRCMSRRARSRGTTRPHRAISGDYTAVQTITLAELNINGRQRKVLMQAPKNGFFYVIDRISGELLSAQPYAKVTWAKGVDMKTGRPIETKQARYGDKAVTQFPGPGGAHNWHPMSFNPGTGLVYIPAIESSFTYVRERDFKRVPGFWNMGIDLNARAGSKDYVSVPESEYEPGAGTTVGVASSLLAWDPVAAKPRWRIKYPDVTGGGTLTTAGNLVFQGLSDGRFVAYTANDGKKLWEAQLGNGIMAAPSTWSLDGKQYVSVLVGWGGATGLYVPNPTKQYKAPGRLFTFVLDGKAKLEPVRGISKNPLTTIAFTATPAEVERGAAIFGRRCSMCHGVAAVSGGSIADLRYALPATYDSIDRIVREGIYQGSACRSSISSPRPMWPR